jgi:hypothetical protein
MFRGGFAMIQKIAVEPVFALDPDTEGFGLGGVHLDLLDKNATGSAQAPRDKFAG